MMKKLLIACSIMLSGAQTISAQDIDHYGVFDHLGVQLGVGTEGFSVGVAAPITDYVETSFGVNFMIPIKPSGDVRINGGNISNVPRTNAKGEYLDVNGKVTTNPNDIARKDFTLNQLNIKGKMARTSFDFKVSVYPFGVRNDFFVVGGLSFGGKKIATLEGFSEDVKAVYDWSPTYEKEITATIDKYNIKIDKKGKAEGDIRVKAVRPYVGLGYGRLVPKDDIGFRVEAGVQFMGKMKVYQNDTELNVSNALADDDFSKVIDKWTVYPVLKFVLTTRIL